eukprot:scaffold265889_cov29-Prasinocladus_malaysianus.AAC.1
MARHDQFQRKEQNLRSRLIAVEKLSQQKLKPNGNALALHCGVATQKQTGNLRPSWADQAKESQREAIGQRAGGKRLAINEARVQHQALSILHERHPNEV